MQEVDWIVTIRADCTFCGNALVIGMTDASGIQLRCTGCDHFDLNNDLRFWEALYMIHEKAAAMADSPPQA